MRTITCSWCDEDRPEGTDCPNCHPPDFDPDSCWGSMARTLMARQAEHRRKLDEYERTGVWE